MKGGINIGYIRNIYSWNQSVTATIRKPSVSPVNLLLHYPSPYASCHSYQWLLGSEMQVRAKQILVLELVYCYK